VTRPRALVIGGRRRTLRRHLLRTIGWDVAVFERAAGDLSDRGAGTGTHNELFTGCAGPFRRTRNRDRGRRRTGPLPAETTAVRRWLVARGRHIGDRLATPLVPNEDLESSRRQRMEIVMREYGAAGVVGDEVITARGPARGTTK
jgi:hypothetical protein